MPLPVLNATSGGPLDVMRAYHRAMLEWGRGVADQEATGDYGTVLGNAAVAVADANTVVDAYLSDRPAAEVVADADATFAGWGTACRGWTLNPSMPAERTTPLAEHLLRSGWHPRRRTVLRLDRLQPTTVVDTLGIALLPTRSAYPVHRRLAADRWPDDPAAAEAAELHLDDARVDGTVAVVAGRAVGSAALLNAGEVGTVMDLYVEPASRRRGVGTTLLRAVLETAARAGHRLVLAGVSDGAGELVRLTDATGFVRVREWVRYGRQIAKPPR